MTAKQKDVGSSRTNDQNFFAQVFFRLGDFFEKLLKISKGPPLHFFLFCKRMHVQKLPKAPLLALGNIPETKNKFRKKIRIKNFKKNRIFFSIFSSRGYCRREYNSYLAYEVVFLHHLRNSTGPKGGTPLEYFRLCQTFFKKKFTKGSPQFFDIFRQKGC